MSNLREAIDLSSFEMGVMVPLMDLNLTVYRRYKNRSLARREILAWSSYARTCRSRARNLSITSKSIGTSPVLTPSASIAISSNIERVKIRSAWSVISIILDIIVPAAS